MAAVTYNDLAASVHDCTSQHERVVACDVDALCESQVLVVRQEVHRVSLERCLRMHHVWEGRIVRVLDHLDPKVFCTAISSLYWLGPAILLIHQLNNPGNTCYQFTQTCLSGSQSVLHSSFVVTLARTSNSANTSVKQPRNYLLSVHTNMFMG